MFGSTLFVKRIYQNIKVRLRNMSPWNIFLHMEKWNLTMRISMFCVNRWIRGGGRGKCHVTKILFENIIK